jgi:CTP synthase
MTHDELLAHIGRQTEETEFYTPMPAGYRPGHHKFVIVVGTVMSGLGKGIFSSSLAKLLQDKGLKVAPIKMEGYLNIDSGTLNPYRHGEVFVLDDGMETDMDLGTYERLLDQDLSAANFTTNGQVLSSVLKKEREGGYLGRDVQVIPHVVGEVKLKLRELAAKSQADVVFVEVGGTVGDYENAFYLEACRQIAYEEGENAVVFVALTYILEPGTLGEQKSKAAQLGIKRLMEVGIMPHIIACRAANPVKEKVREKISMYTNVPMKRVVTMHDVDSIYLIPDSLREVGIDREVLTLLDIHDRVDHQGRRTLLGPPRRGRAVQVDGHDRGQPADRRGRADRVPGDHRAGRVRRPRHRGQDRVHPLRAGEPRAVPRALPGVPDGGHRVRQERVRDCRRGFERVHAGL